MGQLGEGFYIKVGVGWGGGGDRSYSLYFAVRILQTGLDVLDHQAQS